MLRGTLIVGLYAINLAVWAAAYFGLNLALPVGMRGTLAPPQLVLYFAGIGALFSTLPVVRWISDDEHPRWWFSAGVWGALVFPVTGIVLELVYTKSQVKAAYYVETFEPVFKFADLAWKGISKYAILMPAGFLVALIAAMFTVWASRLLRGILAGNA